MFEMEGETLPNRNGHKKHQYYKFSKVFTSFILLQIRVSTFQINRLLYDLQLFSYSLAVLSDLNHAEM